MLCTDCFRTSHPRTLLAGSDRVEMLLWLCLAWPGWLYCAWRHALRIKVCGECGGAALVREARAAAAALGPAERWSPASEVRNLCGPVRWPHPFATPRERLRGGAPGLVAATGALLAAAIATAAPAAGLAPALLLASLALAATWLGRVCHSSLRTRARQLACRAFLPDGRELRIEIV